MSKETDPSGLAPNAPGAKLDAGKIKAGVLGQFGLALLSVADVGTFGANKYSRGGWQHVDNGEERYEDAKWRHLLKADQEAMDPDSLKRHLAHEAWNTLAQLELLLRNEKVSMPKVEPIPKRVSEAQLRNMHNEELVTFFQNKSELTDLEKILLDRLIY